MNRLLRRLLVGLLVGVGLYAVGAIVVGFNDLAGSLVVFDYWLLVPVLGLTLTNYVIRYARWALYLRRLDIGVPLGRDLVIFAGGLSMVVTPGKLGELLKSYLLFTTQGVPMARTMPVVLAERITDLVALLILMLVGFHTLEVGAPLMIVLGSGIVAMVFVLGSPRLSRRLFGLLAGAPGLRRFGDRLDTFHESMCALFRPAPLTLSIGLSLLAWFAECLGAYVILGGYSGFSIPLLMATFVYSATTLGGLPTPGGLGLTDGGMTAMLHYGAGLTLGAAGAATLLIRLCTLWFAVVVGVTALLVFRRYVGIGASELDEERIERAVGTKSAEPEVS